MLLRWLSGSCPSAVFEAEFVFLQVENCWLWMSADMIAAVVVRLDIASSAVGGGAVNGRSKGWVAAWHSDVVDGEPKFATGGIFQLGLVPIT